jgi:hypothetical protein
MYMTFKNLNNLKMFDKHEEMDSKQKNQKQKAAPKISHSKINSVENALMDFSAHIFAADRYLSLIRILSSAHKLLFFLQHKMFVSD